MDKKRGGIRDLRSEIDTSNGLVRFGKGRGPDTMDNGETGLTKRGGEHVPTEDE